SLDGVVESPEKWHFPFLDDRMKAAVNSLFTQADALLLGRNTFQIFAASWPKQTGDQFLARRINSMRKYVISSTKDLLGWENSIILDGPGRAAIEDLRRQNSGVIAVAGSITLVRWLIEHELLDELQLIQHPVVLGSGRQLFTPPITAMPVTFTLTSSAAFPTGVLDLVYGRPKAG
ncbi:MAG: dihydrofolate reductase family protein, partial [Actinomycetota bacterium]|nr:dihydrofolate reductase family protein [Actinomycetota bacterium]